MNRGRRRQTHRGSKEPVPWYSLMVLESGSVMIEEENGQISERTEPMVILLEPHTALILHFPPLSEYMWVDWGLTRMQRVPRGGDSSNAWRYPKGQVQPPSHLVLDPGLPRYPDPALLRLTLQTCRRINGLWWRSGFSLLKADQLLFSWLLTVLNHHGTRQPPDVSPPVPDPVSAWLDMAEQHLEQRFNTKIWADLAGVSRSTLNERLRQQLGQSSGEVLNGMRLSRACDCLEKGHNVNRTAKDCGFNSRTAFSAWFKREMGVPPSSWQRV